MSDHVEMPERRQEQRIKARQRVRFKPAGMELYEGALILNQSESGILLATRRPLVLGTVFEIELTPVGPHGQRPFVGQVMHIKNGHSRTWWGGYKSFYCYGCWVTSICASDEVFVDITDEALLSAIESPDEDCGPYDPRAYEIVDITGLVDVNDSSWPEQAEDLIETGFLTDAQKRIVQEVRACLKHRLHRDQSGAG